MSAGVRWRFVAPNLVTSVGIAVGMMSVAMALQGFTVTAAWLVVVSVLLDKLDGTVARALGGGSRFGVQMDSLADFLSFGIAPTVFFLAGVVRGGEESFGAAASDPIYRGIAYACAILYVVAAALRLAKFNVVSERYGDQYFFGIPTTLAGAFLATTYITLFKYDFATVLVYFVPVAHAGLALLMVSNVPLPKIKPRKNKLANVVQIVNVVLCYLVGLTWFFVEEKYRFSEYLLAIVLVYVAGGIGFCVAKGIRAPDLNEPATPEGAQVSPADAGADTDATE